MYMFVGCCYCSFVCVLMNSLRKKEREKMGYGNIGRFGCECLIYNFLNRRILITLRFRRGKRSFNKDECKKRSNAIDI